MNRDSGDAFIYSYPVPIRKLAPVTCHDRKLEALHERKGHRLLQVKHFASTLRFYTVHLNFKLLRVWRQARISYASLQIDGSILVFCSENDGREPHTTKRVTIEIENLEKYFDSFLLFSGKRLVLERCDGILVRLQTVDPDGHILDFRVPQSLENKSQYHHEARDRRRIAPSEIMERHELD